MPLDEDGFEVIEGFMDPETLASINGEMAELEPQAGKGGIRNAEQKLPKVREYLESEGLRNKAKRFLQDGIHIVRVILFNKTAESNWLVKWHQDKTVAVSGCFEMAGWGPWSVKESVCHVQPPLEVLEKMVTFRIHLDDADLENGCLKVMPGSHLYGRLKQHEIDSYVGEYKPVICAAKAGSGLAMRPLLLHSSSKASSPCSRRVLHIELSSYELPFGMQWAYNPNPQVEWNES